MLGGETSIKHKENDQINAVDEQNCQHKEYLISKDNRNQENLAY